MERSAGENGRGKMGDKRKRGVGMHFCSNCVLGSALKFRSGVQRAAGHMPTTAHNLKF